MKRFFARLIGRVSQVYTKLFPEVLKKRTWWPVFVVGIVLIAVVAVTPAHAFLEDLALWLSRAIASLLLELAKLCIFLAIFFLRYFITLASYNNYIDVSVVKLGWVMVRDVANMFFIVGLLVIAFATILGLESYEWKKGVMKIILMAILINFSNLIAQLVIDVAHIFTITFLNAVSATAGGNLITLFQFDKVLNLAQGGPAAFGGTPESAGLSLFAGSALAFVFALLAALTIGAYLLVMMARIVVLWALIILSPLAFMMYALPKGEEYAHEWWKEFSKHVIVAPIMVFFLWLAFATFGTGQIISEIQHGPGSENVIQLNASGEEQSVSILEISTWENLASFLLGIAFLWVGIKKTEETGATGAGLVGKAVDFTKNVATIATGYAAGRWLVGGAVDKVKSDFPIIGGKSLARKGMMIKGAYNYAKSKTGIGRDSKVQDWEKNLKEAVQKGKGWDILKFGALRFGVGGMIASSKKKDAVAETWEEKAHMADEEHEARISNSGTWGGTGKDEQRIRTELAVKLKQEKGTQKGAEGLINLMNKEDDQVMSDLDKIAETKALAHDLEAVADTRQKKIDAQKVDELEQGHGKASKKLHEAREELATLKPITEQIEQKIAADHHGHEEERIEELLKPVTPLERAAAVGNAKLEKDIAERDEYQRYNDLATRAEKKLENVKGSNKAQMDLSAAETEAQLALTAALTANSKYAEREGTIAESQTRMKDIQDRRNSEKEILLLDEIRKLLAAGGLTASLKAKAELESFKAALDLDQIDATAQQRAKVYESQGDHLRAEAILRQAAAQKEKKSAELFADLQYDDKKVLEKYLIKQISAEEIRQIAPGAVVSQQDVEQLDRLRRQKNILSTLNAKADGDTVRDTKVSAMEQLGTQSFDANNRLRVKLQMHTGIDDNVLNQVRQSLQQQNPNINNTQLEQEIIRVLKQKFDAMYTNSDQKQTALKELLGAFKSAAMKGDSSGLGLISAVENLNTGRVEYSWRDNPDNNPKSNGSEWFASRSAADNISGYANLKRDATGNFVINGFGLNEIPSITEFYRGMDGRAMSHDKMKPVHASWNAALVDQSNIGSYMTALEQMHKVMPDGFDKVPEVMDKFVTNLRTVVANSNNQSLQGRLRNLGL